MLAVIAARAAYEQKVSELDEAKALQAAVTERDNLKATKAAIDTLDAAIAGIEVDLADAQTAAAQVSAALTARPAAEKELQEAQEEYDTLIAAETKALADAVAARDNIAVIVTDADIAAAEQDVETARAEYENASDELKDSKLAKLNAAKEMLANMQEKYDEIEAADAAVAAAQTALNNKLATDEVITAKAALDEKKNALDVINTTLTDLHPDLLRAEEDLADKQAAYETVLVHRDLLKATFESMTEDDPDYEDVRDRLQLADRSLAEKAAALYEAEVTLKGTLGIEKEAIANEAELLAEVRTKQNDVTAAEDLMKQARDMSVTADTLRSELNSLHVDETIRALTIEIGTAEEGVSVGNEGDITVKTANSDLIVGTIDSEKGNVTLISETGSIAAISADQKPAGYKTENIHGNEITLNAKNSIGSETNPLVIEEEANSQNTTPTQRIVPIAGDQAGAVAIDKDGNLVVALRNDWTRDYDETEGTQLKAVADTGSIFLTEQTGDIGAGKEGEITAANGDVVIRMPSGDLAKADNRMDVTVGGKMTVTGEGAVNLDVNGDLTLDLDTEASHVMIYTKDGDDPEHPVEGDIVITNLNTNTLTGTADSNGSVVLTSKGDIGTEKDAFQIATDAANGATLTVTANNANIEQKIGDLLIERAVTAGDTTLTVAGSVNGTDTSTMSEMISRIVVAQDALTAAENQLAAAETDEELEAANKAYDDARAELDNAMAAYEAAGSANDPANDPTVIANGNLNITAGGGVSDENGYGLSVHVGETVNVNAKDDVVMRSDDDIELGTVSGANTEITAIGSITGTKDVPNAAGSIVKLNVISPDGEEANIGTKDQALTTRADELTLTGSNVTAMWC